MEREDILVEYVDLDGNVMHTDAVRRKIHTRAGGPGPEWVTYDGDNYPVIRRGSTLVIQPIDPISYIMSL